MQIRTFWKAREQIRKTMLFFARQPQYSVIFVGRKLGRFGVPGFCVVCLLCLSTRPWGGPPRSGASQGLGIGNIMLVMQGKPNFQRITGATCAPPRPHRPKTPTSGSHSPSLPEPISSSDEWSFGPIISSQQDWRSGGSALPTLS